MQCLAACWNHWECLAVDEAITANLNNSIKKEDYYMPEETLNTVSEEIAEQHKRYVLFLALFFVCGDIFCFCRLLGFCRIADPEAFKDSSFQEL